MKIYTKKGDQGYTSLLNNSRVSKSDDRIELLGCVDELSSHLGLAKVIADESLRAELGTIQKTLITLMSGVASSGNWKYKLSDEVSFLEERIDAMENAFPRAKEFVLFGGCELSARLDVARAVARREERQFCRASRFYGLDCEAQKYINRLADYLYVCARYADYKNN